MKTKISPLLLFIIISVLGVLLHFTFDWSGQTRIVGYFSAVNESTWEHLKLLFFPMLFVTVCQCFFRKDYDFLIRLRAVTIPCGMFFLVAVFYIVWGITGKLIDWVNIGIYFLSVAFTLFLESKLKNSRVINNLYLAIFILAGITLLFFLFTYHAPKLGIFFDLELHPKTLR